MGRYLFVGGQEDGRFVTILHGRRARFPKREAPTAQRGRPPVVTDTVEFVEYTKRAAKVDGQQIVEFFALAELDNEGATNALIAALRRP